MFTDLRVESLLTFLADFSNLKYINYNNNISEYILVKKYLEYNINR